MRLFYEIYKKLLNICVLRVKRNYLAHGTPLKTENIQLIQQQLIDASSLDKYLDIKPGPQRSYYNALAREKYKCEVNPDHTTFLNVKNNQPYMEAMPLIPLSSQCDYKVSLRAQENICCLCPECKAKLTYADNTTREDMIVRLYDKHKQKLKSIGISITLKQLLDYGMIISTQQQIQKKTKRKEDNRLFLFSLLIVMTAEDEKIVVLLHKICSRGNSAEVKQNKDGTLKVYEIKKNIVSM